MRRRAAILAGALIALSAQAAGPAHGESSSAFLLALGGVSGGALVSETNVPVTATGELAVSFHGDEASGCGTRGICAYSGTVTVEPGSGGMIALLKFRRRGGFVYQAELVLGLGSGGSTTTADVQRTPAATGAGLCGDAEQPLSAGSLVVARRGFVTLPLLHTSGSLLATRCAGPLDADVAGASPRVTIPIKGLMRGRTRLDLGGVRSFAANGFAGTVSSSLVLRLGKPQTTSTSSSPQAFPRGNRTERVRTVIEKLALVSAGGNVTGAVQGTSDPTVCGLLDSCGLAGTLTITPGPVPRQTSGEIIATGPATRPLRDFLAALGRSRSGNPHGIHVFGDLGWSDRGSVSSALGQSGTCRDAAPLGAGEIVLQGLGKALDVSYGIGGAPRTRCPGPMFGPGATLASGAVPHRDLANRTITVDLNSSRSIDEDGYTTRLSGRLTLTLRPGRAFTQRVSVQPVG